MKATQVRSLLSIKGQSRKGRSAEIKCRLNRKYRNCAVMLSQPKASRSGSGFASPSFLWLVLICTEACTLGVNQADVLQRNKSYSFFPPSGYQFPDGFISLTILKQSDNDNLSSGSLFSKPQQLPRARTS